MQKFSAALLSWSSPRTNSLFIAPHHCAVFCCAGILSKRCASSCDSAISLQLLACFDFSLTLIVVFVSLWDAGSFTGVSKWIDVNGCALRQLSRHAAV
jgi:hypothetical protein